jgi:hypothetical protein
MFGTLQRRTFLFSACGSITAGTARPAAARRRPPNVVMVLTDDQGYGDLACLGNPVLKTPHLDALHARRSASRTFTPARRARLHARRF